MGKEKRFHYIRFRLILKEEFDLNNVISKLQDFIGYDFKKDKIKVEVNGVEGALDNEITIIEIYLKKVAHTNQFMKKMFGEMSDEDKKIVSEELEERLDEDCHFYMRFDKDLLFDKNELKLTNAGNCIHLKFSVASYPKSRNVAMSVVREVFAN